MFVPALQLARTASAREALSALPDAPVVEETAAATTAPARPLRRTRRATAGVLHRAADRIAPAV